MPASVRLITTPTLLLVIAALLLAGWWRDGRLVPLPDAPTARLECVSYSPSGATDGMPHLVTPEHIRADLERIAVRFGYVRTYSVAHGLYKVPSIARELGLEVLLGAWIGRDPDSNEIEIERAIGRGARRARRAARNRCRQRRAAAPRADAGSARRADSRRPRRDWLARHVCRRVGMLGQASRGQFRGFFRDGPHHPVLG